MLRGCQNCERIGIPGRFPRPPPFGGVGGKSDPNIDIFWYPVFNFLTTAVNGLVTAGSWLVTAFKIKPIFVLSVIVCRFEHTRYFH